jgi:hypothetical protein
MVPLPKYPWSESHLATSTANGYWFHHLPHHFIGSLFESRHVMLHQVRLAEMDLRRSFRKAGRRTIDSARRQV